MSRADNQDSSSLKKIKRIMFWRTSRISHPKKISSQNTKVNDKRVHVFGDQGFLHIFELLCSVIPGTKIFEYNKEKEIFEIWINGWIIAVKASYCWSGLEIYLRCITQTVPCLNFHQWNKVKQCCQWQRGWNNFYISTT